MLYGVASLTPKPSSSAASARSRVRAAAGLQHLRPAIRRDSSERGCARAPRPRAPGLRPAPDYSPAGTRLGSAPNFHVRWPLARRLASFRNASREAACEGSTDAQDAGPWKQYSLPPGSPKRSLRRRKGRRLPWVMCSRVSSRGTTCCAAGQDAVQKTCGEVECTAPERPSVGSLIEKCAGSRVGICKGYSKALPNSSGKQPISDRFATRIRVDLVLAWRIFLSHPLIGTPKTFSVGRICKNLLRERTLVCRFDSIAFDQPEPCGLARYKFRKHAARAPPVAPGPDVLLSTSGPFRLGSSRPTRHAYQRFSAAAPTSLWPLRPTPNVLPRVPGIAPAPCPC